MPLNHKNVIVYIPNKNSYILTTAYRFHHQTLGTLATIDNDAHLNRGRLIKHFHR